MSHPAHKPGRHARPCPALDGFIKPADCGAQRGSKLACPPTCSWFPFGVAGYDHLLQVELVWFKKTLERLASALGPRRIETILDEASQDVGSGRRSQQAATEDMLHRALTQERDAAGRTVAESWAAQNWLGLDNDSRYFMEHRLRGFVTVIEVDRVTGDKEILCRDLLDAGAATFTVVDRSLASQALRFTRLLTWTWHFPRLSRIGGEGITIDYDLWSSWRQRLDERLARERRRRPGLTARELLTADPAEGARWVYELSAARRQRLLESLDVHQCVATWALSCPMPNVAAVLRSLPDFEEGEPERTPGFPTPDLQFAWLRRGESQAIEAQMALVIRSDGEDGVVGSLGTVRLYPDRLVVETLSRQKHAFARGMIERFLGPRVRFENERIEDMRARIKRDLAARAAFDTEIEEGLGRPFSAAEQQAHASATAPAQPEIPREVKAQVLRAAWLNHYRRFLDDRIPALDGMTPRQAAGEPRMRARLVDLMKGHVHGVVRQCQEEEFEFDLGWVLDELGLAELK